MHLHVEDANDDQRVHVDSVQFQQVLFTLAMNAADAMPDGGNIRLFTRQATTAAVQEHLRESTTSSAYWCIDIVDEGSGMDHQIQQRIFEPFFTTKDANKGTGLGLPVVKTIMDLHKGWIDVSSEPGRGTTFTLGLPAGAAQREQVSDADTFEAGNGETLLIVDDEEPIRVMLKELLSGNGYQVLTAGTGQEAIDIVQPGPDAVQLVLTDIGLPDINGKDLIDRLHNISPELPIIAMTGYVDEGLNESLIAVGASIVVNKPYDLFQLSREIHSLIRLHH